MGLARQLFYRGYGILISGFTILAAYQACAKTLQKLPNKTNPKQISHKNTCDRFLLLITLQKPIYFHAYQEHLKAVQLNEALKNGNKGTHYRCISVNFENDLIAAVCRLLSSCFFCFYLCSFSQLETADTTWKVSKYGVFSGQYFPVFLIFPTPLSDEEKKIT